MIVLKCKKKKRWLSLSLSNLLESSKEDKNRLLLKFLILNKKN